MRSRIILLLIIPFVILAAACQSGPPTMVVLVVTATPETAAETPTLAEVQAVESTAVLTPTPAFTETPAPTATTDPRPPVTTGQIQVAEQVFEHGRLFWIQPRQQIWVMFDDGQGSGQWSVYEDTFVDGEPESDPSIVPPPDRYQPTRGFGKLWRNNTDIQNRLGFAITPEFGYVSNYEYHPGGALDAQGVWQPGPGFHIMFSLYNEKFQFNETDGRWQKLQ
ncbi:MAG: hypothetical protein R3E39_02380 [Anaerolineae bacterium]